MSKAQSTLEYALLIGVVVGALLLMQNYLKRGVMGKTQVVADQIGDPYSPGLTYRHEFMKSTADRIVEDTTRGVTDGVGGGMTTTTITGGAQEQNNIREIKSLTDEKWPGKE